MRVLHLLKQCKTLRQLKQIQSQMILTGLISYGFASSRLIVFCSSSDPKTLYYCTKILYNLQNPDVFSWNTAMRGYIDNEYPKEAIAIYKRMFIGITKPDKFTYPLLFKACANLELYFMSFEIFGHVVQLGFDQDLYVRNAMIHVFVSIGRLDFARKVFDEGTVRDLVSWNSLINGYVRNGKAEEGIRVFVEMTRNRVEPDEVTMVGAVSLCAQLENLELGRELRRTVEENGLNLTTRLANALMNMYVKCGDLKAAKDMFDSLPNRTVVSWTTMIVGYLRHGLLDVGRRIFDEMPDKNAVTWNAIIGGYIEAGRNKEALALFNQMQASSNLKPDKVTMVLCLSACSQLGALDVGTWIHLYVKKHNFRIDVALGTALVDMYAKCGHVRKALQVFHEMPRTNPLTWTAIIGGLAHHGNSQGAISYFLQMINIGLKPDEITLLAVLSACCHGGLVEEGWTFFTDMKSKYNLSPQVKHYACMVDLLGRAGLLADAEELIKNMPMEPDTAVWGALFFASHIHRNVPMGERAAEKLLKLDPEDSGIYVLLATMYREAGMLKEAEKVRKMMRKRGLEKNPGSSSIEVNGIVYEFMIGDESHPGYKQIRNCLFLLTRQLGFQEFIYNVPVTEDVHKDLHIEA